MNDPMCQVCGTDTSIQHDAVRIFRDTKADGRELLAIMCLRCAAKGAVWAAQQARKEELS